MSFQDYYVVCFAHLSNNLSQPNPYLPSQDRLAVLWDEHKVVVALIDRMRAVTVLLHRIPNYRKPPEGFA